MVRMYSADILSVQYVHDVNICICSMYVHVYVHVNVKTHSESTSSGVSSHSNMTSLTDGGLLLAALQ